MCFFLKSECRKSLTQLLTDQMKTLLLGSRPRSEPRTYFAVGRCTNHLATSHPRTKPVRNAQSHSYTTPSLSYVVPPLYSIPGYNPNHTFYKKLIIRSFYNGAKQGHHVPRRSYSTLSSMFTFIKPSITSSSDVRICKPCTWVGDSQWERLNGMKVVKLKYTDGKIH